MPFVTATVVRAAKPTSVRPGDAAIVLADGTIDGFVGGVCAQASVRLHAARVLETGEAVLLRLFPGARQDDDVQDGVVVAHNPCLSGGSLEIFLDPHLAAPRVLIVGETPIARALEDVARAAGYDGLARRGDRSAAVRRGAGRGLARRRRGGRAGAARCRRASATSRSSRRPGAAPRCWSRSTSTTRCARSSTRPPAWTSARARRRTSRSRSSPRWSPSARRTPRRPPRREPVRTAVDPVCGMQVVVSESTPQLVRRRRARVLLLRGLPLHVRRGACPRELAVWCWRPAGRRGSGSPKQLLPFGGATLLDHTLGRRARRAGSTSSSACSAGARDEVRATVDLAGVEVVVNEVFGRGCSSSIAAALRASIGGDVLVLLLGDQPGVEPASVRALVAGRGDAPLAVCRYDDGRGHPFAFARSVFGELGGAARRQGRLEAARPRRRRGRRGAGVRDRSRPTSTRGRTTRPP